MNITPQQYADITARRTGKAAPSLVSFFAAGVPAPGGSKKGFYIPSLKRVVITDAGKRNKPWREAVASAGAEAWRGKPLLRCALSVRFTFTFPRPKSHYRNNGQLKPAAPSTKTSKPDVLKLGRSTEDALTGIIWADDASTVRLELAKGYSEVAAGVFVEIYEDATAAAGMEQ